MATWSMLSLQDSASPFMEELTFFHDSTMALITGVLILVASTLVMMMNTKFTDQSLVQDQATEIVWTTAPVIVLLLIALPSLKTLYLLDDPLAPSITVKTMGHQWYWSYEYSDFKGLEFDSYMETDYQGANGDIRLLEADNSLVVPQKTGIRLITSATDVIHAWTVPAMGVKADAVPGRLNQMIFNASRPGIFYGQCSEICGANHSFMPIKLEVAPLNTFLAWVDKNSSLSS